VLLAQAGAVAGPSRVVVESATDCPTAAEVEQRLRVLLPPLEGAEPARATLAAEAGALRVRLRGADGATLAERTLTVAASCADRANVVAVVIAAWDVEQRAERVEDPTLPRPPRPPRAAPPSAPPTVVAAPPPPPAGGPRLELALAPGATLASGVAPSAALTAGLWGRHLGARLGIFGLLPRTEGLGAGLARWTRVGATLEAAARASGRLGRLDGHAGLVAAAVVAHGSGFDVDRDTSGFSPGACVGVDWSYLFGRAFSGAGASLSAFPEQRLVFSSPAPATRELPRLEPAVDVVLGVIF
jgi:hypothetical protein